MKKKFAPAEELARRGGSRGRVRGIHLSWKVRSASDRTIRTFEHQNSDRNSVTIQEILSEFIGNSESWGFKLFIEILRKFDWNWCKIRRKLLKNRDFCWNFSKNMKKFDKNLRRFWASSGAKVRQSCRFRKTLQNDALDAKIGVDTAENEPSKNWWFGWNFWEKFGIELFN